MIKLTSKYKFPLFVIVVSLALIAISLFFNFEKKREKDALYQRISAEQQARKEAWEAEQKIYLLGKFDQTKKENFILAPARDTTNGNPMYLRKETLEAFLKMKNSAEKDGVNLKIASATRNFEYQRTIWNNKWTGLTIVDGQNLAKSISDGLERFKKILEYSAVPGTSRHHWGTDIDINDATPEYFKTEKGAKVYIWLVKNAPLFGFCQPYNQKGSARPTGHNEEKWHWSYLPLAKTFIEEYKNLITEKDITGFLGDQYVPKLDLINNYMLSINPDCL